MALIKKILIDTICASRLIFAVTAVIKRIITSFAKARRLIKIICIIQAREAIGNILTCFATFIKGTATETLASRKIKFITYTSSTVSARSTINAIRKYCATITLMVIVISRITYITCSVVTTILAVFDTRTTIILISQILIHIVSIHANITLLNSRAVRTICNSTRCTGTKGRVYKIAIFTEVTFSTIFALNAVRTTT